MSETATIIQQPILEKLNEMGYRGPHGPQPELTNVDGEMVAALKKKPGSFIIQAHISEEFCHRYTVYHLTLYPKLTLHSRDGYRGPVAVLQIRNILEEDIVRLGEFETKLTRAGEGMK